MERLVGVAVTRPSWFRDLFSLPLALVSCCAFIAIFVNPRTWYQDFAASLACYWIVPLVLLLASQIVRSLRKRTSRLFDVWGFVFSIAVLIRVLLIALPFYRVPLHVAPASGPDLKVFFANVLESEKAPSKVLEVVARAEPGVVILDDYTDVVGKVLNLERLYPYQLDNSVESPSKTEPASRWKVYSKYPWDSVSKTDLGDGVLGASALHLQISYPESPNSPGSKGPSFPCWLGILHLLSSRSADDFEISKVTSRRLASILKNSHEPALLVGRFNSSPFSRIYTMYTEQVRMIPAMAGYGLISTWDRWSGFLKMTSDHALVRRGMFVREFSVLRDWPGSHRAILFTSEVPPADLLAAKSRSNS